MNRISTSLVTVGTTHTALSGSASVRHMRFGYREYRSNSIRVADIKEHALGNHSCHLSGRKIHDKQRLLALHLTRIARSLFIPAKTVRLWSPKLTSSATNFYNFRGSPSSWPLAACSRASWPST